ncbi:serine-rich adhesin for platelets-like isoform X2 [Clytia hemisphaerica]|uniref:serine-rich adhesin for platelets-like isoform X2 n=1 Tax=Clytia hemisphaerica TaxID=252671 RepID=UPI0034D64C97
MKPIRFDFGLNLLVCLVFVNFAWVFGEYQDTILRIDQDEANILQDILPDLNFVHGIIAKHSKKENAERREKIPNKQQKQSRHSLDGHHSPSFIKEKKLLINFDGVDKDLRRETSKTRAATPNEFRLHEIDFNKLLQKLLKNDIPANEKRKIKKRTKKAKKRKQIRLSTKPKNFTQRTVTPFVNRITNHTRRRPFHNAIPKERGKKVSNLLNAAFQSVPTVLVSNRKRLIKPTDQFLVLFHKNTSMNSIGRQRITHLNNLTKIASDEFTVLDDEKKAFHKFESISEIDTDLPSTATERDKSIADLNILTGVKKSAGTDKITQYPNAEKKFALRNSKEQSFQSEQREQRPRDMIKNQAPNTNISTKANSSNFDNRANKFTESEGKEIINSIEDIGKSLSSVKSNVTDENEPIRNETNVKMLSDFSKTPSNINDTRKEFGTGNLTTPLTVKDDGKLTNESILRTMINNATNSIPPEKVTQLNSKNGSTSGIDVSLNNKSTVYTDRNREANTSSGVNPASTLSGNSTKPLAIDNSTMSTEYHYNVKSDNDNLLLVNSTKYQKNENEKFPQSVDLLKPQNQTTEGISINNSSINQPFSNYQANPTPYVVSTGGSFLENQSSENIYTNTSSDPNTRNSTSENLTINNALEPQANSSISNQTTSNLQQPPDEVGAEDHSAAQYFDKPTNEDMMAIQNLPQENLNVPLIPPALENANTKTNNAQISDPYSMDNQGGQITEPKLINNSDETLKSPTQEQMTFSTSNTTTVGANIDIPEHKANNTSSLKNSEYPMNPTAVLSPEKKTNDSFTNVEDIMELPASFNTTKTNNSSIQLQRKNIIPTPSPRDRLAREYIPMYAPTVYSEDVNDFLDGSVVPRQLKPDSRVSETTGLGQSDVASLTSFLANERMEEQTIANEAQSVTRIHPHRVTAEKKEQETPVRRDKQEHHDSMQTDDIKLLKDAINVGEKSLLNFIKNHLNQKDKTLMKLKAVEDSLESKLVGKMKHKRNITQSLDEATATLEQDSKSDSESNESDERKNLQEEANQESSKTDIEESPNKDTKVYSEPQENSDNGETKNQIKMADIKAEIQADKSELGVPSSHLETERKEEISAQNSTVPSSLDSNDNSTLLSETSKVEEGKEFSNESEEQKSQSENVKPAHDESDGSSQSPGPGESTPMVKMDRQNAGNITSLNEVVARANKNSSIQSKPHTSNMTSQAISLTGSKKSLPEEMTIETQVNQKEELHKPLPTSEQGDLEGEQIETIEIIKQKHRAPLMEEGGKQHNKVPGEVSNTTKPQPTPLPGTTITLPTEQTLANMASSDGNQLQTTLFPFVTVEVDKPPEDSGNIKKNTTDERSTTPPPTLATIVHTPISTTPQTSPATTQSTSTTPSPAMNQPTTTSQPQQLEPPKITENTNVTSASNLPETQTSINNSSNINVKLSTNETTIQKKHLSNLTLEQSNEILKNQPNDLILIPGDHKKRFYSHHGVYKDQNPDKRGKMIDNRRPIGDFVSVIDRSFEEGLDEEEEENNDKQTKTFNSNPSKLDQEKQNKVENDDNFIQEKISKKQQKGSVYTPHPDQDPPKLFTPPIASVQESSKHHIEPPLSHGSSQSNVGKKKYKDEKGDKRGMVSSQHYSSFTDDEEEEGIGYGRGGIKQHPDFEPPTSSSFETFRHDGARTLVDREEPTVSSVTGFGRGSIRKHLGKEEEPTSSPHTQKTTKALNLESQSDGKATPTIAPSRFIVYEDETPRRKKVIEQRGHGRQIMVPVLISSITTPIQPESSSIQSFASSQTPQQVPVLANPPPPVAPPQPQQPPPQGKEEVWQEEMNMEDMYWTDSPDEIENACRKQRGTNLVVRVLAFGDSLTRGYYNKGQNHHPYTGRLQSLLNRMDDKRCFIVENQGKDGDIAFGEMPKRMETLLRLSKKHYDWIIILGGTNDIYNKQHSGKRSPNELSQNIIALHNIAHHHGAHTVAITIPEVLCENNESCEDMKAIRDNVNDNIKTYALDHRQNVVLCDMAELLARNKLKNGLVAQFFEGGLHLKPRGYETMARLIFESIKESID